MTPSKRARTLASLRRQIAEVRLWLDHLDRLLAEWASDPKPRHRWRAVVHGMRVVRHAEALWHRVAMLEVGR
jgi:hypothetical protein